MKRPISSLKNLGPISESMLQQVGIFDGDELLEQDPVEVFLQLKLFGYQVNHNMLWALHGAINDIDWRDIKQADKDKLLKRLDNAEPK